MRSTAALVLVALIVVACAATTAPGSSPTAAPDGTTPPLRPTTPGATSATTDTPPAVSNGSQSANASESPAVPAPIGHAPAVAQLGLAPIEQLTPTSGGGRRPLLEWSALPGAAYYFVVLRGPSGGVYWAWRTADTSVPVGGLPRLDDDAAGPAVSVGMTWSVSAVDGEGKVIGLSEHRPISP